MASALRSLGRMTGATVRSAAAARSATAASRRLPVLAVASRQLSTTPARCEKGKDKPKVVRETEIPAEYTELVRDFVEPGEFHQALQNIGVNFFCGVPDSLLKDFCAYITANVPASAHVITANEGSAIAMAAGHYLATKQYACVYMQNSGLGNMVNPLMSLAHPDVYSVPMLIMMGWRGEPGKKDEPQHRVQGEVTPAMLASMGVPFQVLPDYIEGAEKTLQTAKKYMQTMEGPYVLLVKRRTFRGYKLQSDDEPKFTLNREGALKVLLECFDPKDVVVGTTGMLSRELFEQRVALNHGHEKDFLTVGSMGHASNIALGIALSKPNRRVICLDGDGAAIMHMGSFATIGNAAEGNYKHILINNGAHDSVGGQPTDALHPHFNFAKIAEGCGYRKVIQVSTPEEIKAGFKEICAVKDGPAMMEIFVNPGGHRKDLGRPTRTPIQNKADFMEFLDRV